MSTVVLPEIAVELACCHLISVTDMKSILIHEGKMGLINDDRATAIPLQPRRLTENDSGLNSVGVNCSHVEMMTKAIKILKRENVDPTEYKYALAHARTLPDSERTVIAMGSRFFTEMVPEEALIAIMGCVNME